MMTGKDPMRVTGKPFDLHVQFIGAPVKALIGLLADQVSINVKINSGNTVINGELEQAVLVRP